MDEVEDDVDAALTWKALQDADVDVAAVDANDVMNVAPVGGDSMASVASAVDDEEEEDDDDDDDVADFVQLADLPPYTEAVGDATSTLDGSDSHAVESEDAHATHGEAAPLSMGVAARFKRKNFSKHLQFLCLQRYVDHVKTRGTLPNRSECQLLLHQSFVQFVREGGSADHPRLSYPEFLKLIRNRSRERQERLAKTSAATTTQTHTVGLSSAATQASTGTLSSHSKTLNPRRGSRKRKWTEEVVKIDELIEVIDKARRRASSSAPVPHTERVGSANSTSRRRLNSTAQLSAGMGSVQNAAITEARDIASVMHPAESSSIVDSILKLQQETLSLQHVMKERLESIQEQCCHHEPASASV